MRTYTTGKAAALAGCSRATMARLKQKGVLEGGRGFVKAPNRQVLAQTVEEATKGRHGWKWRQPRTYVGTRGEDRAQVQGMLPELLTRFKPSAEPPTEEDRRQYEAVRGLRQWVAFPPARRELLLTLANRYTDEELGLLAEL